MCGMNEVDKLLSRGVAEAIIKDHLESALRSGKKLRVKFGADPTAPDLHLGHTLALRKLKQFQDLGHKVVFIIGDYTAKIGDPSGRSKTRPPLTDEEIKSNAKTYFKQVGKILDLKKTEVRYNSEWFGKQKMEFLIRLASRFTMQRTMERDDFTKRWKEGAEIFDHELFYPMLQAYDSIEVKADVEVGGTDQKFNMLAGRDLQRHMGLPEQNVITVPLLVGTDGEKKMSKSTGNYIAIADEPNDMFGKIMSVPDELIDQYYELCTDEKRTVGDSREAKLKLGEILVGMYHGDKAGAKAKEEFVRVISEKGKPSDIPRYKAGERVYKLVDLLVETELAVSKSEARRLVEQGGVEVNEEKVSDPNQIVKIDGEVLLKVGKRKYLRVY